MRHAVPAYAGLLSFAALVGAVHSGAMTGFDESVRTTVHSWASPPLTSLMRAMTAFGEPAVLSVLSLAASVVLAIRRRRKAAFVFLIGLVGTGILDGVLKLAFHRPRPPVSFFGTELPHSYSFPSGHSLFAVCFFGILAVLLARERVWFWTASVVLPFLIGLSRVYLGVHYPSDVLGGFAIGVMWVALIAWGRGFFLQSSGARVREIPQPEQVNQ